MKRGRRRSWLLALAVTSWISCLPTTTAAQAPAPADSAAVLVDAASEFESRGRGDIAEALLLYVLERYPATAGAARAREVLEDLRLMRRDGGGRVELQVWGTLYGLWLGVAVPAAFGADGAEPYGAGILLGAPAGFLAARALTRSRALSEGQTRAITWGGTWGTWQGLGWAEVLDLGRETVCTGQFCYEEGDAGEARFGSMVLGGLAGAAAGTLLARREIPAGVATGAHYGSLWGSWLGVAGGVLFDVEEDDTLWMLTLLTGNAGLAGGAWAARRWGLSRSRVRLMGLGGLLGGLAGLGLDLLIQPDDGQVAVAIPLALSVAGLGTAVHLTRDYDGRADGRGSLGGARAGDSPGLGGGGALVRYDGTRWGLDVPLPTPAVVRSSGPTGREERRAAWRFTLLSARF